MKGNILLFEDRFVRNMWPITLTRPAFAVTCACYDLYQIARLLTPRVGYVVRDYLRPAAGRRWPDRRGGDGSTLFLNASAVPDVRYTRMLADLLASGRLCIYTCDQRVAAALLPAQKPIPEDLAPDNVGSFLLDLQLPVQDEEPLELLDYPFHLVGALEELFMPNIKRKLEDGHYEEVASGVFVGEGVKLPDTAVFHTDEGPVVLDDGVRVRDFTYFEGPVYVGPHSRIIERSSVKECVSVGHTCKIGGEVEVSVLEPYTNKQHHGFLGHAYVGSWVNMGAGTSNSDLKNTYGPVRMRLHGRSMETGMQFLGCIIGDFTKTAINTSIFTGKTVGVASMLYGFVGQNVASFCNYAKTFGQVTEVPLDVAVTTQRRMFVRRDVEQTDEDVELLRKVFELTREQRQISDEQPLL